MARTSRKAAAENIPIRLLQCRACKNPALTMFEPVENDLVQAAEPRSAIRISKRSAGLHLPAVRLAVIVIALGVFPSSQFLQLLSDRRLPRPHNPHQDCNHARVFPKSLACQ